MYLFQQTNNPYYVSQLYIHNIIALQLYNLAGIESGSAVSQADAMSTAPRRQGKNKVFKYLLV
jgi:hypothetical protein